MTENKITIEDFIKLDLRIGTIIEAEEVEDSRKMLKLRINCLLYTSPSPRDRTRSRMPSSA